jgi:hypothetical protein
MQKRQKGAKNLTEKGGEEEILADHRGGKIPSGRGCGFQTDIWTPAWNIPTVLRKVPRKYGEMPCVLSFWKILITFTKFMKFCN